MVRVHAEKGSVRAVSFESLLGNPLLEAEHGVAAIGSGGGYALAAARGLVAHTSLDAAAICRAALEIAGDICIYTNRSLTVLPLDASGPAAPRKDD